MNEALVISILIIIFIWYQISAASKKAMSKKIEALEKLVASLKIKINYIEDQINHSNKLEKSDKEKAIPKPDKTNIKTDKTTDKAEIKAIFHNKLHTEDQKISFNPKIAFIRQFRAVHALISFFKSESNLSTNIATNIAKNIIKTPEKPVITKEYQQNTVIKHQSPKTIIQKDNIFSNFTKKIFTWFMTGNVPVKVGMLILILGVSSFFKYAIDQEWIQFSIKARLIKFALLSIAAFGFAWYKRKTHRVFSLTIQGGSIGVLLITLFAASKYYDLLSLSYALAFSVLLIIFIAFLSIKQNAVTLAIFAVLAGFLAPIILSSGSNNYVGLFSYYILINIGILIIAWFRPWQFLNSLGFILTFGVALLWGIFKYEPLFFASTEPFAIIFFIYSSLFFMPEKSN